MRNLFCFIIFILNIVNVTAQKKITFRLTDHNNIIIKTLVNEKDSLHLMFQVAMMDAAISPERIRKADHIKFDNNDISNGNLVKIGDLEYNNIRFFNNELSGQESDGKIGTGIFKDKIYKIDYDNNQFIIYDKMPNLDGFSAITLTPKNEIVFVDINNSINGENYIHPFYLQSGYPGGLLYDNSFSDEHHLIDKLTITGEKTLKNSAGKSVITKQSVLPLMKIGNLSLENVSAGFFMGDLKTQPLSLFGADLMKRFIWIFDADRKTAYIKPSKYYHSDYFKIK